MLGRFSFYLHGPPGSVYPHNLAISVVLQLLPPSYKDHVRVCVMRGDEELLGFRQFLRQLRNVTMHPIEGEIID